MFIWVCMCQIIIFKMLSTPSSSSDSAKLCDKRTSSNCWLLSSITFFDREDNTLPPLQLAYSLQIPNNNIPLPIRSFQWRFFFFDHQPPFRTVSDDTSVVKHTRKVGFLQLAACVSPSLPGVPLKFKLAKCVSVPRTVLHGQKHAQHKRWIPEGEENQPFLANWTTPLQWCIGPQQQQHKLSTSTPLWWTNATTETVLPHGSCRCCCCCSQGGL